MPGGSRPSAVENIHREPFGSLFLAFVSLEFSLSGFLDFCFLNYLSIISVTLFWLVFYCSVLKDLCALLRFTRFASIAFFTYTVNPKKQLFINKFNKICLIYIIPI